MPARPLIAPFALFLMLCQQVGAASPPDKLDRLLSNSPFGQSRPGSAVSNGTNDPLEFRGVLEENGNKLFSIYETGTRRSTWVELNDPVNGFSVKGYNPANETLTVDYQNKSLSLPIKRAAPVAQATPFPPAPSGLAPSPTNPGAGPVAQAPVDQQRLQQIQEEIRRRRAMRQQTIPPGTTVSETGPQPGPMSPTNVPPGGPGNPMNIPPGSPAVPAKP